MLRECTLKQRPRVLKVVQTCTCSEHGSQRGAKKEDSRIVDIADMVSEGAPGVQLLQD